MKSYDVAVCGGEIAGISAALITVYLPLCDGYGHQGSFGIAEELLKLSVIYGAEEHCPENWLDNIGRHRRNHDG